MRPTDSRLRALDWLNFFIADIQTGFGPFVAVYLTAHRWTQLDIGAALSVGTIVSLIGQLPAGALVDAVRSKRRSTSAAILAVIGSALMLAIWPARLPVFLAEILHGLASCAVSPSIAAISLILVGRAALGERLGRNARFSSIGAALSAALMGAVGYEISNRGVFWLTALFGIPALLMLRRVGPARGEIERRGRGTDWKELRALFTDRRLVVFSAAALLFHLANAAMLPLAAGKVTVQEGSNLASLIIAACIVVPQFVVAALSPWVGRTAERRGRRPLLLLGWAMLPLRGVLLAMLPSSWLLIAIQSLDGVSAAIFGIMLPLVSADITRGTNRFNLCMGAVGTAVFLGAAASTSLAGAIDDALGSRAAFLGLGLAGAAGVGLLWLAMPETRVLKARDAEEVTVGRL